MDIGPSRDIPHQISTLQALARFAVRIVILGACATFGSRGFAKTFGGLLSLAIIFCILAAAVRREELLGPALSHWDEAAAYGLIGAAIAASA